jgi:hypothetical protein
MRPHEFKPRKMLSTVEAARYCSSSASSFAKFRLFGGGPIVTRIGRRCIYDPADLDAWLAAHRCTHTGDLAGARPRGGGAG